MDIETGVIIKALVLFFALFFFSKPLFYLFETIRDMITGKNQGGHNLDELISQKKTLLSGTCEIKKSPKKDSSNKSMTLEERYSEFHAKGDGPQVKKMLDLIRALQWGGEGVVDEIGASFRKKHGYHPKAAKVVDMAKSVLYGKYAQKATNQDKPPSFSQVEQAVHCLLLVEDDKLGWNVKAQYARKGLDALLADKRIPVLFLMKNKKEFLKSWRTHALFYQIMEPIPAVDSDDKALAEKILGLAGDYTLAQLKDAYKKAAKRKHPDLLAGMKAGPRDKKKAEENFANLKKAYDLLLGGLS